MAGNGLDIDEYVRRAYKFAYSDCIEVGPVACLPEPPDPNELYPRQSRRQVFLLIDRTDVIVLCLLDFPQNDEIFFKVIPYLLYDRLSEGVGLFMLVSIP